MRKSGRNEGVPGGFFIKCAGLKMLYESLRVTIDKKIILLFGMALATQATASGKGQIRDDIAVWIRMADTWLKKRMAIDLPEEKTGF